MANVLAEWIRRMDWDDWAWIGDNELLQDHQALHRDYGDAPIEDVIPIEQRIAYEMRRRGFEHRHTDKLSQEARTLIEKPAEPTVLEARGYLDRYITLRNGSVSLAQDISKTGQFYAIVEGAGLSGLEPALLRLMNRWLPPGFDIKMLEGPVESEDDFVSIYPLYDLRLEPAYAPPVVSTWASITVNFQTLAAKAAPSVFPEGRPVQIPFTVAKSVRGVSSGLAWPPESVYVLGPVLIPGQVDKTQTNPDGTPTGAVGDVATPEAVSGAFEFWTVAKRAFEYQHAVQGGRIYDEDDITPLDNWRAPVPMVIENRAGEQIEYPETTWFLGSRINEPQAAEEALSGELTSWSIFANCLGRFEEVQGKVEPGQRV